MGETYSTYGNNDKFKQNSSRKNINE